MFDKDEKSQDKTKPTDELELKVEPSRASCGNSSSTSASAPPYHYQVTSTLPAFQQRGGRPVLMLANASTRQEWPSDYLCWSFLNIACGSWIFGIVALIFSITTIKKNRVGEFRSARKYSDLSFNFNLTASVFAIITW